MLFRYRSLSGFYYDIGALTRYSSYTLSDIYEMIPYEFDVLESINLNFIQKEKESRGQK